MPELYKADEVAKAITDKLDELKKKSDLLSPKFWLTSADGWRMKLEEAKAVAEFLVGQHQPKFQVVSATVVSEKGNNNEPSPLPKVMPKRLETTFVPKVGAPCPECGQQKLVRKGINRSDGTETDFLACKGYPDSCKAIFPLVAVVRQIEPNYEVKEATVSKLIAEGVPCPRSGTGKLVRKLGNNGKSDFLRAATLQRRNAALQSRSFSSRNNQRALSRMKLSFVAMRYAYCTLLGNQHARA